MSSIRHLAVIMFTDISGYTSLMSESEERALQLLEENRNIQKPLIESHDGELVKEMGDGILAVFNSSKEAVHCALEILEQSREVPGLNLKIGIHLGDITFSNGDVFGDGVNIASRVQDQASAGQILVTNAVYETIKNQENINASFFAEKTLKNVPDPVKIYEIKGQGEVFEKVQAPSGKKPMTAYLVLPLLIVVIVIGFWFFRSNTDSIIMKDPDQIRIAVLPISDLSENGDQQYFADAVTREIIRGLFRIDIHAPSPTSVEKYLNTQLSIQEIGKALNADFVIEGYLSKTDEEITLSWELRRTDNGEIQLAEHASQSYSIGGLGLIQKNLAEMLVSSLSMDISPEELELSVNYGTEDIVAYDLVQQGWKYYSKTNAENLYDIENFQVAIDLGKMALKADSTYAEAYGLLTNSYAQLIPRDRKVNWLDSAQQAGLKGINIDSTCASCYAGLAKWNPSPRENVYYHTKALEIDPSHSISLKNFGITGVYNRLHVEDRWEKAVEYADSYIKYYPEDEITHAWTLMALNLFAGNKKLAIDYLKLFKEIPSDIILSEQETPMASRLYESAYELGEYALGNKFIDIICESSQSDEWCEKGYWKEFYYFFYERRYKDLVEFCKEILPSGGLSLWENLKLNHSLLKTEQSADLELSTLEEWDKRFGSDKIIGLHWYRMYAITALQEGEVDKAILGLRKIIENEYLPELSSDIFFEDLYQHPEFQELVRIQKERQKEAVNLIDSKNFPSPNELLKRFRERNE